MLVLEGVDGGGREGVRGVAQGVGERLLVDDPARAVFSRIAPGRISASSARPISPRSPG
ncbi:hypothetical protein [Streptomyces sp. CBG31]|uniref:hypothetical protein n=1 Tax=Streptomyces sp. CBG31 TaxID=2762623 RepID=UPI0028F73C2E|nr:hypothetical protein [Streptomyces sp. CBG31]